MWAVNLLLKRRGRLVEIHGIRYLSLMRVRPPVRWDRPAWVVTRLMSRPLEFNCEGSGWPFRTGCLRMREVCMRALFEVLFLFLLTVRVLGLTLSLLLGRILRPCDLCFLRRGVLRAAVASDSKLLSGANNLILSCVTGR